MCMQVIKSSISVHGDIRHLEIDHKVGSHFSLVHGDIRHLESQISTSIKVWSVHGDIRHLEMNVCGGSNAF